MSALNLLHKRQFVAVSFPEDAEHLNPMPFEAAARMEKDLSEDLRAGGTRLLAEREEWLTGVRVAWRVGTATAGASGVQASAGLRISSPSKADL